ncbi:hypothetical protein NQZ68_031005 [Dissostichus eleginoides]|nr:hypothetical protein NQZ68_031005 [Dissostichus eleginoides]
MKIIQIIKANAVPLCAVAMGTGTAAASSLLFALAGNQSLRGGSYSTPVLPEERDQIFLTTSALSSTQHASPDADKICMCHNLQQDPTPCKPYHTPLIQSVKGDGLHGEVIPSSTAGFTLESYMKEEHPGLLEGLLYHGSGSVE